MNENREAAPLPKLRGNLSSICAFPAAFQEYFDDRFAFRDKMIALRTLLYLKLFGVSGSPKVVIGKNGFFFYADNANRPMYVGSHPFSPDELQGWKNLLEKRDKWCKERGMDYFFVLAPVKSSVYPELLPNEYANRAKMTRTDELIAFLKQAHSPVRVIDLRQFVRAGKGPLPLYMQTDTHWNQLGCYYGYKGMMDCLREKFPIIPPPLPLTAFNIRPYHFAKGDLSRMQGLLGIVTETNVALDHKIPSTARLIKDTHFKENKLGLDGTEAFGYHQNGTALPSAVMFRDSFACYMIELFLPENFSRISFFWQPDFSEEVVLREKPNMVVQEALESCLYLPPQQM